MCFPFALPLTYFPSPLRRHAAGLLCIVTRLLISRLLHHTWEGGSWYIRVLSSRILVIFITTTTTNTGQFVFLMGAVIVLGQSLLPLGTFPCQWWLHQAIFTRFRDTSEMWHSESHFDVDLCFSNPEMKCFFLCSKVLFWRSSGQEYEHLQCCHATLLTTHAV